MGTNYLMGLRGAMLTLFTCLLTTTGLLAQAEFITTWKTDNPGTTNSSSIRIPATGTYDVDLGNDGSYELTNQSGTIEIDITAHNHTAGEIQVALRNAGGGLTRIHFNLEGDRQKLLSVDQWGSSIAWSTMETAFQGCTNLDVKATDAPNLSKVTDMRNMFHRCTSLKGNASFSTWNTSNVTNMWSMFLIAPSFNAPIGSWDTSNVIFMQSMFNGAAAFNGDISSWNTSKVTRMGYMFDGAKAFNQNIGSWDTSQVVHMDFMFWTAYAFDQNLGAWDLGKLTSGLYMFSNSGLSMANWDATLIGWHNQGLTNSVTIGAQGRVYCKAYAERAELIRKGLNITGDRAETTRPTAQCKPAILILSTEGTATLTSALVDNGSSDACGDVSLSVSQSSFTAADLGDNTVTLTVTDPNGNTQTCQASVTVVDHASGRFVTTWDTNQRGWSNSNSITIPIPNTDIYDVDLGNDGSYELTDQTGTIEIDITAHNHTAGEIQVALRSAVSGKGSLTRIHFNNKEDRRKLSSVDQWGSGIRWSTMENAFFGCTNLDILATDAPDLSNVTNMAFMFSGCANLKGGTAFSIWNTANVTNMRNMFSGASAFNQEIGSWNTSNVTDMIGMLLGTTAFDQNLGTWNMGKLTNGIAMLNKSGLSVENWDNTLIGWHGQNLTNTPTINALELTYCNAYAERDALTFNISGDNLSDANPEAACKEAVTLRLGSNGTATLDPTLVDDGSVGCADISLSLSKSNFTTTDIDTKTVILTVTDSNSKTATCTTKLTVEDPTSVFVTTWDTTKSGSSNGNSITIPVTGTYDVDLGNDGSYELTDQTGTIEIDITAHNHTAGEIQVALRNAISGNGTLSRIHFPFGQTDDRQKLLSVDQWGSSILWSTMQNAFHGCTNMDVLATDVPDLSNVTNMGLMFFRCTALKGTATNNFSGWNTSGVTNMAFLFASASAFDQNLDSWNVAMVTTMEQMFSGTSAFDQDLDSWNTGKVADMSNMFYNASAFNGDIGSWDTGNVNDMSWMFSGASTFDRNIGSWNTAKVSDMESMFAGASAFDRNLGNWYMGKVSDGIGMLNNSGLSVANWDATLIGWHGQNFTNTPIIGATGLAYCKAHTERAALTLKITGDSKATTQTTAACKQQAVELELGTDGKATLAIEDVDDGSDGCGISLGLSQSTFAAENLGDNTVTLTVTDPNSNSDSCTATVTVQDSTKPTPSCKGTTVQLDASGSATIATSNIDNGSSDNSGGTVTLALSKTSFDCSNVGTNTVTLTVTDPSSNSDSCTATVTVQDKALPTTSCKDATVQLGTTGSATLAASDLDNGSSDNCTLAMALSKTAFSATDLGTNSVTLTVTDPGGNSGTCTATVTVQDSTKPTPSCKGTTVQLDASGSATIATSNIDNGSSDNSGGTVTLALSKTSFDCSNVGTNTVTLTVTDPSSNSDSCTATVTVQDKALPTTSCKDATVQLGTTGSATLAASDLDNGSSDNCTLAMALSKTAFSATDLGTNSVTLTVTDPGGNSGTCTATVTVQDSTKPTPSCKGTTVQLDASGSATIATSNIDNGSSDNSGGTVTLALSKTSFDCSNVGTNTVTLTVTDPSSNSDSCTATVTVQDKAVPTTSCKDATVQLGTTGSATLAASDLDNGSSDNCTLAMALSKTAFSATDLGTNSVTLTVTDPGGNSGTCTATVTVQDKTAPTPSCQDTTVQLDASGSATIATSNIDNGSSDNSGGTVTLALSKTSFDCSNVGTNTVTLTVTDPGGNSDSCTATVTVQDKALPTTSCKDATVQLGTTGSATLAASDLDNGSSDNCTLAMALSKTAFSATDLGTNSVTLTVTDPGGNSGTCTATVTVQDKTAPTPSCKGTTVQLDASGSATIATSNIDNGSSDNSGGTVTLALSKTSFDCSNVGTNTVTLTVTDPSSNSDSCTATVTVQDKALPTTSCKDATVQLGTTGSATLAASDLDNGSSDNCTLAMALSKTAFSATDLGTNSVTLTVTDPGGNSGTCTATVTVQDKTAPTPSCKGATVQLDASGSATIATSNIDNGSSDNSGGTVTLALSKTSFDCSNVGTNTVTLTVTDPSSNSDSCTATVTVQDKALPTTSCKDATVQLGTTGSATLAASDLDNGSSDNCTLAMALSKTAFSATDLGTNSVTLTVTDPGGNSGTCTATVTVQDKTAPTPSCKGTTVQLDASGSATIATSNIDNGSSDNSGGTVTLALSKTSFDCSNVGTNTVTLTVTDPSSNSDSCTATVTVQDKALPTTSCKDATVQLGTTGSATLAASDLDNGSSDNCTLAMALSKTAFSATDLGTNSVTLTVTDPGGNSGTCTATVTVQDKTAPTPSCKGATVQLDASGSATIATSNIDNGSSDNSGGTVTLALSKTSFDCSNVGNNTVTLTVTDPSSNSDSCTATVTVQDKALPTTSCKDATVQLGTTGSATLAASDLDNGSSDNCTLAMALSKTAFSATDLGTNSVTLTVTDPGGNSGTCTATVTVQDSTKPTPSCKGATVQLGALGSVIITTSDIDNGSYDNSGTTVTLALSKTSFDCSNVGTNTVTLTVTDPSSNSDSCTATVTVKDRNAPTALCKDTTVQLDAFGSAAIVAADLDDGSSDTCGSVSLHMFPSSFTSVGTHTATLRVIDGSNNTDSCTATVTVEDRTAPTPVCREVTIQLDTTGSATISALDVDNGSSDNSGGTVTLALSKTSFDCSNVGNNTVTLTVTDPSSNSASCTAVVTVQDKIRPKAVCQVATLQLGTGGTTGLDAALVDNGSSDACGNIALGVSPNSFTATDLGANTVTLTVTDGNGNIATCQTMVTVVDGTVPTPTASCRDISVELDATGSTTIVAADVDNGSFDGSGGTLSLALDTDNFGCSDVGQNTVTLTVTEKSGNTANCTSTVTVRETTAPLAIVTNSGPICQGSTLQLNEISGLGTSWSWTSNGDATFSNPDIQNPEVTNVSDGEEFTLTMALANGCTVTGTTTVFILGLPILETEGEQVFCTLENPTVSDLAASGNGTLRWYSEANSTTELGTDVSLGDGTVYYGSLEDGNGCTSDRVAVTVRISVEGCDEFPDADRLGFSPNGDGVNDTFSISWLKNDYPNYSMSIYDRNGTMVYQGNISTPEWDGSADRGIFLRDGKLPNGVYYYTIDFGDGITPPVQGIVYLNR
ncbi:BspA family leucine-rich repeat surface protein [Muricauda sp. SCSIO 64092]|uniref:BspA family leucine-rich repeat surface protein n=1 Tax=Allomuricauda sp. SCSIO 64092 TaxID=2908842 RepID=UPI001FF3841E|nr:BspA family leucine-rich repeat surface protein [Muricauda sp. SCSIO 64092]UOY08505.1 BspA family leucine-rich repeat surface protein [Muricauda sp. SCSIO 64092]